MFLRAVFRRALLLVIMALMANSSLAAGAKNIRYVEAVKARGATVYVHYKVTCATGASEDISAWNDGKKWCAGRGRQDRCTKKRVKIARWVCEHGK